MALWFRRRRGGETNAARPGILIRLKVRQPGEGQQNYHIQIENQVVKSLRFVGFRCCKRLHTDCHSPHRDRRLYNHRKWDMRRSANQRACWRFLHIPPRIHTVSAHQRQQTQRFGLARQQLRHQGPRQLNSTQRPTSAPLAPTPRPKHSCLLIRYYGGRTFFLLPPNPSTRVVFWRDRPNPKSRATWVRIRQRTGVARITLVTFSPKDSPAKIKRGLPRPAGGQATGMTSPSQAGGP
jgi:hypothetical protein